MAFENQERDKTKSIELAAVLDDLILANGLQDLEGAIRFMGENTRRTLKRALELAEK